MLKHILEALITPLIDKNKNNCMCNGIKSKQAYIRFKSMMQLMVLPIFYNIFTSFATIPKTFWVFGEVAKSYFGSSTQIAQIAPLGRIIF
jgi:hypothetical protein